MAKLLAVVCQSFNLNELKKISEHETLDVTYLVLNDGILNADEINKQGPDLILFENVLHDSDKFEICKNLKQNPKTRHIPVILLLNHSPGNKIDQQIKASGAEAVLTLPLIEMQVLLLVESLLKSKKANTVQREQEAAMQSENSENLLEKQFSPEHFLFPGFSA